MSKALIRELENLLKYPYLSCPYSLFIASSVNKAVNQVKALTKEKFLSVYNRLRENYKNYEKAVYKEVMGQLEEHLKKLKKG
ncbi:MAG: hypothetical protein ACP5O8_01980 [Candidatus Aenigmatarchaeota archaeon]